MSLATGLAGNLFKNLMKVPGGKKFLKEGGSHLISQSLPGSFITAGLTTLSTGNPFAGALVGGADLITSSALARGLGSNRLRQGLTGFAGGKDINLGGKFVQIVDPKTKQLLNPTYQASMPQNLAMLGGSIGATLAIEPHFYRGQQQTPPNQQMSQMRYG